MDELATDIASQIPPLSAYWITAAAATERPSDVLAVYSDPVVDTFNADENQIQARGLMLIVLYVVFV